MIICSNCGEKCDFSVRVKYEKVDGVTVGYCEHDGGNFGAYSGELATSKWGKRIRQDRMKHAKEILQPFDKYGRENEHFKKVYGEKAVDSFKNPLKKGTNLK